MTARVRLVHSRRLRTRYFTIALSRQQNWLRLLASVGAVLTLLGLFVAAAGLPWYLGAIVIVLAAASVVLSHPLVPVAYAVCYLVSWLVCVPRTVSVAGLVAALGFVVWHGVLSMAGSAPKCGRLAAATVRRWVRRLAAIAGVVVVTFVVAAALNDPGRPPSRVAVVIGCLLVMIVLVGALLAARVRMSSRPPAG